MVKKDIQYLMKMKNKINMSMRNIKKIRKKILLPMKMFIKI